MTGMAVSADNLTLAPPVPASTMWLPANALNCYVGDAVLRSWLNTPGLLTQRIREAAGDGFSMHVLREERVGVDQVREIDMCCDGRVWMFAHTRIPANTLAAQPWLASIGARTLGEALAGRASLEREEFRFAQCYPDTPLAKRVLEHTGLPAQPLWVRHSAFRVAGEPFDLYEVFLPGIGVRRER